jgi:uncharacterized protein with HEPN domain
MSSRDWSFRIRDILFGMRNLLIHEYFGVDIKIVWHTAKKYLPALQKQLQELLKKDL